MDNFVEDDLPAAPAPVPSEDERPEATQPPEDLALVKRIQARIKADKQHHSKAFDQMRKDMFLARTGRTPDYPTGHYAANLCGRHVKVKTAALYAKNPKAVARRRDTLDFQVWDESPQSLQMAMQTVAMAQQMIPQPDPETGAAPIAAEPPQEMIQAFEQATALISDFQSGTQRRQLIGKIGKTLEVLFAQALREQKPVDFRTGMKQMVRRACTTGVGYIELGFQREYGPRPGVNEQLSDARARLDHMKAMAERIGDSENPISPDDPEIAELEHSIAALTAEPEIVLREGLFIDFPQSTRVIPDTICRTLVGFIGARHLTVELMYTPDQVNEMFDVKLGKNFRAYSTDGKEPGGENANYVADDKDQSATGSDERGMVCVWKHYDKVSGLVYYLADGYNGWLREPAAPDVFVEDFWPVYALTFNEVESEEYLFPPSDVHLIQDQQMEYNRAKQGLREHRQAARPRFIYAKGSIEHEDIKQLATLDAFDAAGVNVPPGSDIKQLVVPLQIPGVDPNLYEVGQIFSDIQLIVGSSEAQFGGIAKATATEASIAASSSASSDGSSVDDLDAFLTMVTRAAGQILLREMSEEQVMQIVGPGAVWPHMTLAEIASEVYLEIEAGSSGKPNQAIEVNNFERLAPILMQIPSIDPIWLAKQAIKRLDDRLDITEAISMGVPAIMAQNRMSQMAPTDPGADPQDQGGEGAANGPRPGTQQPGSSAAFGSNQV
jgi:hypothetical protein